ncbi:protein of unassigned function [Methylobacterium oryzae CBMB20]|uniref:Protein of unassigned function n=1 Tax=Methylobacterium oryzae CBMB20 TaxID=693986 RepID=A0A089NU58_9HYPH|nr:protein of unassigned function [Methylobacterium oryzae CBMB20]
MPTASGIVGEGRTVVRFGCDSTDRPGGLNPDRVLGTN